MESVFFYVTCYVACVILSDSRKTAKKQQFGHHLFFRQSKEEGKDQESIQSNTTHDPGQKMEK